ncbi:MAG: hypothetical protein Q9186_004720 [Xanthomendoza sp. 1 TL-2023]
MASPNEDMLNSDRTPNAPYSVDAWIDTSTTLVFPMQKSTHRFRKFDPLFDAFDEDIIAFSNSFMAPYHKLIKFRYLFQDPNIFFHVPIILHLRPS